MEKRRLESRLRRALRDARRDDGNVLTIFALALPVVLGAAAFGVETTFEYISQTRLQVAADAAAYAAALDNRAGQPLDSISAGAKTVATSNGWVSSKGVIQVATPPTTGPNQTPTAVEVVLTQNVPRFFTAVFSPKPLTIRARAVAIYRTAADACILALNKTAGQSVNVQGNTQVKLVGCDIMSNSIASNAVNIQGSSTISSECVVSAGGVANSGGLTLTGADCPSAITQAPRAHDPFDTLPAPSPGPTRNVPNGPNKNGMTLSPGNYTNGMDLNGNVTLAPGTYYVSGGNFDVNANASVTGTGVTIYLQSGSTVTVNGTAHVDLSAPLSGTYSGILFFGDRNATGGNNKFNGDGSSQLTGDLYFPTQAVNYQGNFSGQDGCMQIVADTVSRDGVER